MLKIGLISLGCAKNLVDSEHMLSRLREAGHVIVDDMAEAEVAIINTCGFIESAKQEAINTILETAQYKDGGALRGLVVTGCLAQRYPEEIAESLPEVDVICGTGSYTDICEAVRVAAQADANEIAAQKTPAKYLADPATAALEGGRDRLTPGYTAYLKIAEGCSNRCAYCIIPKLRGKYRSRDFDALLAEARALAESGVQELIIIAQDITKYGMDLYHERKLPALLRELCKMDFHWIRLHYLYPDQITEELIDVIAEEDKIVKYLDIPLQHVSKRILRAMHRPGGREEFTILLDRLRERIPGLVLRTSLIVGLPGETEEEFTELCEFLQEVGIERAGVFEFSPEEGTEAAELPDQIEDAVKENRRLIVEELQSGIIDEYNLERLHQTAEVLVEGWDEDAECWFGRTYADSVEVDGKVYFESEDACTVGSFVEVRMDDSLGADLAGVRVGG